MILEFLCSAFAGLIGVNAAHAQVHEWDTAIDSGGLTLESPFNPDSVDLEVEEILRSLNRFQPKYEFPVLIYKDGNFFVNDSETLEAVLKDPNKTVTSL